MRSLSISLLLFLLVVLGALSLRFSQVSADDSPSSSDLITLDKSAKYGCLPGLQGGQLFSISRTGTTRLLSFGIVLSKLGDAQSSLSIQISSLKKQISSSAPGSMTVARLRKKLKRLQDRKSEAKTLIKGIKDCRQGRIQTSVTPTNTSGTPGPTPGVTPGPTVPPSPTDTPLPQKITYDFTLSGAQEVPPNSSTATGHCTVVLETTSHELDINCTHNVSAPEMAHIHRGAPGANGTIICGLNLTASTADKKCLLALADQALVVAGNTYINIHSTTFFAGEIRGQVK